MRWIFIIIVVMLILLLLIWIIYQNQKDLKDLEKQLDETEGLKKIQDEETDLEEHVH